MSGQQHRASRCVFVGNIPYDATEEQLVQICEEVGPVVSFRLVVDRDTGKPKGYGFCEFRDEETALSARRNLQGYEINGRQLRVDFAENEKGGGGVDRSRDQQGRGGPGFQQSGSNLDTQKHYGGVAPQAVVGGGGAGGLEQPLGRAAASAAALVMAGALGGVQQLPNMMVQGQGHLQTLGAPPASLPGNGGAVAGTDALTNHLAGMSKHQLYEIMSQMKIMIQQNQQQARQILVANPQLTKALFQAQIMLGMVRPPQVVSSQQSLAQQAAPSQQPANLMQQQTRPPQPHVPPPAQIQANTSNQGSFLPPLPQPPQLQQQSQQVQQPQQPQQQPQPPLLQAAFQQQGGMVQTSMGMSFQPGQPPPPTQPPPQQLYQMGSNMMGTNVQRMGTNASGGPVGQGNGGMISGVTMGPSGTGQLTRGPALSGGLTSIDNRAVQLNQGPPSSGAMGGVSGIHGPSPMSGGGPISSGRPMATGNVGGGASGMGASLPSSLTAPLMMGDPSTRGYSGMVSMNSGMNTVINTTNTAMNPSMNSGMNPGMNTGLNANLNPGLNSSMNTGMVTALNAGINQGMNTSINPSMNSGIGSGTNMNSGMSQGMNQGMNSGLNLSQTGGFAGTTDGTAVTTAALQPQAYSQVQLQAPPPPQQSQVQVPLELEQQKALLQQVMNLTSEQIMSLPPEQRQQVLQLQQALR